MENNGAVFLDRDGVLIEEVHYLSQVDQVRLLPGVIEALAHLNKHRIPAIVVTNQAGVARGYFSEARVSEVHQYITKLLATRHVGVDRFYYCPHHPDGVIGRYRIVCQCRKPNSGMLYQAAADFGLNLSNCYFVGDRITDLEAAGGAGCHSILVRTGYGAGIDVSKAETSWNLCHVAADLQDAVRHILPKMIQARAKKCA